MKRPALSPPRKVALLAATLCALALPGCVTDYDRDDIAERAASILGGGHAYVSRTYEEHEGEDGYTDRVWTVVVPETGLEFHIVDDRHWGMETLTNSLRDDYVASVLALVENDLPESAHLRLEFGTDEALSVARVVGSFRDALELAECREELVALADRLAELGYGGLSARYVLEYEHPLRNATSYAIDDGDSWGWTDEIAPLEDMLSTYVALVIDLRYEDVLATLPEGLVDAVVGASPDRVGVYEGDQTDQSLYEPELIRYYDGLLSSRYAYGISFGTLYEVLLREGLSPEGTSWHYSFVGADGSTYEVSYDFCDHPYETDAGIEPGYYYLRDGEPQEMGYYFYNHFAPREIEGLTGLRLVDERRE